MAKKTESKKNESGKIAAFVARYSNKSSGAGYKSAIVSFLRCMFGVTKTDNPDYETLFDQYITDKTRDHVDDFKTFADCLKNECSSNQSARQIMTYARKVLEVYGVTVPKDAIGDLKREMRGGAATVEKILTHEVICKVLRGADVRGRAMVTVAASSGLRIGELLSLKISDVDLNTDPVMITIRAANSKNKQPRYTFISSEAREHLIAWLEIRSKYVEAAGVHNAALVAAGKSKAKTDGGDLVFPFSENAVGSMWATMLSKAGLYSVDSETGRNQLRWHGLRKFFISQLSMAGAKTLAEHLAGHTGYLDGSYRRISPEHAAREYKKIQSCLIVCLPPTVTATIKLQDEKIALATERMMEKTESIEGLRAINEKLQTQVEVMFSRMEKMQEKLDLLLESYPPTKEEEKQILSKIPHNDDE